MSGEITPDTYERDLKINERAEAWMARAVERLSNHARVEAEIGALVEADGTKELEELTIPPLEIEAIDTEFIAALKENWWMSVGTLGTLQYQLDLITKNNPDAEPLLFDQQYGALRTAWKIGRLSPQEP